MAKPEHDYQIAARQWIAGKRRGMLYIDMGLGKTRIILEHIVRAGRQAVVFAPLSVIYNTWPLEIAKWVPGLTYRILHGPDKDYHLSKSADIYLVNYDGLQWFYANVSNNVRKFKDRFYVLDESTKVKSHSSVRLKAMKPFANLAQDLILMSGTPMPNGYRDLWAQFWLIDHGQALGKTYSEFRDRYLIESGPPRFEIRLRPGAKEDIDSKVADMTFRLDKKDYLSLKDPVYSTKSLILPTDAREGYDELENDYVLGDFSVHSGGALNMKLRQYVQGAVYDENSHTHWIHSTKLDFLEDLVDTATSPILLPIQFRFELEALKKRFKNLPCIAGGMKPAETSSIIRSWNSGNVPLLPCHPAALSHGVNMQDGGHHVVWFALPYNLEHYEQLNGRLARQGQVNTPVFDHLIMSNTVDEDVKAALDTKAADQVSFGDAMRQAMLARRATSSKSPA